MNFGILALSISRLVLIFFKCKVANLFLPSKKDKTKKS